MPLNKLDLPSYASSSTTKHLQKELRKLLKTQSDKTSIFRIDRTKLDNLYTWHAYLYNFSTDLPLSQDLDRLSLPHVEIEIKFGPTHPLSPPYIRVVQPRFLAFSQGGGGHVTAGGSICMSMLTMDDWSPVYSISQVLVMVHSALSSVDPKPAKISDRGCYNEREALEAYLRVAETHGWRVPEGWQTLFNRQP
jgi:ubiquitin-conjugating enzyme E2 Q